MNLEGAIRGVTSEVQGRRPGRESGGRSSPEADDFSQFKGYLAVTSGILGGSAKKTARSLPQTTRKSWQTTLPVNNNIFIV